MEQSLAGIYILDGMEGRVSYANPRVAEIFGYTQPEMLGKLITDFAIEEDRPIVAESVRLRMQGEAKSAHYIYRGRRKDGSILQIETLGVRSELNGAPVIIGTLQDVTEKKKVEDALRHSEERLRQAARVSHLGTFEHDHFTDAVFVSPESCEILEFEPGKAHSLQEFIGKVHPEDRAAVAAAVQRSHDPAGDGLFNGEFRLVTRDGSIRWLAMQTQTWFEGEGSARHTVRTIGALIDVTSHKLDEQALRQSEDRLQQVVRVSRIGIFDHDHVTDIIFLSPENREIVGLGPDDVQTVSRFIDSVHPEDRARVAAAVQWSHDPSGDGLFNGEFRIVLRDGIIRWVAMRTKTLFEGEGSARRAVHTIGALLDITEAKQAEQALRLSEERLRQVVGISHIGIFDHDLVTGEFYVSPERREISGFSPDEPVTIETDFAEMHPEDRDAVREAIQRNRDPKGDGTYNVDRRIVRRDGSVRWVSVRAQTLFEGQGSSRHAVRTIGAMLDITEQKQAEQTLRKAEARFRALVEQSLAGIYVLEGAEDKLTYFNPRFAEIFGYTPAEIADLPITRVVADADRQVVAQNILKGMKGEVPSFRYTFRGRHKDGTLLDIEAHGVRTDFAGTSGHSRRSRRYHRAQTGRRVLAARAPVFKVDIGQPPRHLLPLYLPRAPAGALE